MEKVDFTFSRQQVAGYFDTSFSFVEQLVPKDNTVIVTDENVFLHYQQRFSGYKSIVVPAGENFKSQATVNNMITRLIELQADRQTMIIGVGGGVVTDMAGYLAAVYMRGIRFGIVPTSLLCMVDASLGGKNGVDVGMYKNLVGTIRHPEFILYDMDLLETLPDKEWVSGFAEIIKHACIKDVSMFEQLEQLDLESIRSSRDLMKDMVKRNVMLKYGIVSSDELEDGERRLLNFGHTFGHAIENTLKLPHGHAISIGMVAACMISEEINNFYSSEKERVIALLKKYRLPVKLPKDDIKEKIWELLLMDKKKSGGVMNFVLLNRIGEGIVKPIPIQQLNHLFNQVLS